MNKWIPVSDRLPETDGIYLVSGKMKYNWENEYEYFVDCAEYLPLSCDPWPYGNTGGTEWGTWNDWYEGQQEYEILAWQPLPEPYKDEGRG